MVGDYITLNNRVHPKKHGHGFHECKVHGAIMGPTWVLSAPSGPHIGPMNLTIRVALCCVLLWFGTNTFYPYPLGPLFTKKSLCYWYRDSHYKPKMIIRPSWVYDGDSYTPWVNSVLCFVWPKVFHDTPFYALYDPKCFMMFPWCTINASVASAWCTINAPAAFA